MIHTFDRLEKQGIHGENVNIILTPGAHFSFANPVYYYYRLLELRERVRKFKKKFPDTKILFKGLNWLPGDFVSANAVISSWNGMVLEKAAFEIFGDEKVVSFLPLYNKTKFIWDQFSNTRVGIHPGKGKGGNRAVLQQIMRMIHQKLKSEDCEHC